MTSEFHYDILLIALSLMTATFAMYITFGFIGHLYRTISVNRNTLLALYSVAVGTGLWAIHLINQLIFHHHSSLATSSIHLFASWLFSLLIGFTLCYVASKKVIALAKLLLGGAIIAASAYAMFYFSLVGINQSNGAPDTSARITFDLLPLLIALSIALTVSIISLAATSWMKDYAGENKVLIKLIFSFLTSITILAVHSIFNTSVILHARVADLAVAEFTDKPMLALVITLGLVCLFLLAFVIALYYEKFGVSAFQFHIMERQSSIDTASTGYKDPLTKLPNRRAFQRELEVAAKRSGRANNTIALAYIDLDHFKPINDNFGHHVGDAVLLLVAQRLNAAVRICDTVARIGGDEFVALIEDIKSDEDIIPIVERIVQSIKEPFVVESHQIDISCSVGIAVYPRDGDIDRLMVCADAAMYKAKEDGKNQFRFFDAEIESASDQMLEMQRDLCLAIENNEFSLVFQPKIHCKTQSPVGAEALIRWNHPSKGVILPIAFIPAAERFGLINQINDWVVEESCRVIDRARHQGIDLNVSINLAPQQFRNQHLVDEILQLRKRYVIPADNLMFEIKETTAIRNEAQFKHLLQQFKAANIKVALDDFGSYHFSLSYLQNLSINEIKLDKVFISQINESDASRGLVDAVIRLAHALHFNVVAEGVETEAQRSALVDLNCDHMQGYLFSKPLSEARLFQLYDQLSVNFESTGQFSLSDYQVEVV